MERLCPKCGHPNASASGNAMEACPKCGVIYSKAAAVKNSTPAPVADAPSIAVILTGRVLPLHEDASVWSAIGALFKLEPESFKSRILAKCPVAIRQVTDPADAHRIRTSLFACGAETALVPSMGDKWSLKLDGRICGPVPLGYLLEEHQSGRLGDDLLVKPASGDTWTSLSTAISARSPSHTVAAKVSESSPRGNPSLDVLGGAGAIPLSPERPNAKAHGRASSFGREAMWKVISVVGLLLLAIWITVLVTGALHWDFMLHRKDILSQMRAAIQSDDFSTANALYTKYKETGDPELKDLKARQIKRMQEISALAREKQLLAEAKNLSTGDYAGRAKVYTALASLFPANAEYRSLAKSSTEAVERMEAPIRKAKAEAEARERAETQRVERLKDIALSAQIRCKSEAVDSAKWGAESDWGINSTVRDLGNGNYEVVGRDVKMKNGFNAIRYVVYRGIYDSANRSCRIVSVE